MFYIIKVFISAILIVFISEISKRSSVMGALLASLPIVSLLSILWLYWDTGNTQKISELSISIFWLVIPSLSLFLALPLFLKYKWNFYAALGGSIAVMLACYGVLLWILDLL